MPARTCNGSAPGAACLPVAAFVLISLLARPSFAADVANLAYATNCSTNTVSSYDVDRVTGQPRRVQEIMAGKCPVSVAVHPSGQYVYVQNAESSFLSLYTVAAVTGGLNFVTTVPTGQGRPPGGAIVHPSGAFLYVSNHAASSISAFSIDPRSGVPTVLAGSPFPAGAAPGALAVHPGGRFLYAVNFDAQSVSGYAIDPASGRLAPIPGSPFAAGSNPKAIGVHPSGKFAYVANLGSHDVSVYRIDAANGALRELLPRVSAGIKPSSLAVHSRFVYVANMRSHDISTYRIDPTTGALREARPRVQTPGWPEVIALYPLRKAIYATSYRDEEILISAFAIDEATGTLTQGDPVRHGRLNRQSFYSAVALSQAPAPALAQGALRVLFEQPPQASPARQHTPLQVSLILDASNSMWGQGPGGRKIDLAKKAITSLVQDLPDTSRVALRVYGHRHSRDLGDCQDSELLVPMGPLNKTELIKQVESITPRGMTPLAYSLKQVLKDLGDAPGEKLVILVSDGKESCGGDPVAAVKALRQQGVDMRIEVVGLAVADTETKRQLDSIATLARGRYRAAKDAPELKAALADAVRLAFTVEDQSGMVARGMVGAERLCLEPGKYRINVRSQTQTFTFNDIAIAPGEQTRLTLVPQAEALGTASRSETLTQPCPIPARPASLGGGARTP